MKKFRFLIAAGISLALIFGGLASCKKKTQTSSPFEASIKIGQNSGSRKTLTASMDDDRISYNSMLSFFVPDYSTETPDYPAESEKSKTTEKKSKKEKESTSVIPGIKKLGEYKTKYSSEKNRSLLILLVKNKQKRKIFRAFLLL